ncbi:MAG: Zn-ribbon domain-containing OB-fold protein [Pseudomonadota bacterium]
MQQRIVNHSRPLPSPETNDFWRAVDQRKLMISRCADCQGASFYPRPFCPHCGSDKTHLEQVSGKGSIYSFSVMRKAEQPYVIAYVQLEEGPCLLTNIAGCDFGELEIGLNVRLEFAETNDPGLLLPVFVPAE